MNMNLLMKACAFALCSMGGLRFGSPNKGEGVAMLMGGLLCGLFSCLKKQKTR